jgi:hypothetical protein
MTGVTNRFHNMEFEMIRTFAFGALASIALAVPAMAATTSFSSSKDTGLDRVLDSAAMSQQIRTQLMSNGFTHVSAMERGPLGRWEGTAMKNGKVVAIAVLFPPAPQSQPAID